MPTARKIQKYCSDSTPQISILPYKRQFCKCYLQPQPFLHANKQGFGAGTFFPHKRLACLTLSGILFAKRTSIFPIYYHIKICLSMTFIKNFFVCQVLTRFVEKDAEAGKCPFSILTFSQSYDILDTERRMLAMSINAVKTVCGGQICALNLSSFPDWRMYLKLLSLCA